MKIDEYEIQDKKFEKASIKKLLGGNMLNKLKELLSTNYGITNVELTSDFKSDFNLTSFDFINLIYLLEENYGVVIEEDAYFRLDTISDLLEYIESRATV